MAQSTAAQGAPRVEEEAGTLFRPGRNCWKVARANRAALLVDGEDYFRAFAAAAERAQRSIFIVGWDFNSRTLLRREQGTPIALGDFLNGLVRRNRRLRVHILDWDFPMVFGADRELPLLYGTTWRPHRRILMRYDNTHPTIGSHHQKIVVVDGKMAFSGGFDLTCKRWDTRAHRPDDPLRVSDDKPYPPFHDVMMAVDGEAALALAEVVRDRWLGATGKNVVPVKVDGDPWPEWLKPRLADVDVAISRTIPVKEGVTSEVREVEALYLDMIARAKRTIYIENQYFTSHKLGEALAARLAEPGGPDVVVVSRRLSHGWLEEHTMHVLRTRLVKLLRAADREGRFHIYYPHVPGLVNETCLDVHSKVMVADDEWLRVGSANFSNRSMGMDTECDLTIEAAGREDIAGAARDFRDGLIAEHLGIETSQVGEEIARRGSLSAVIEALRSDGRSLRPLEDPDWPDAVVSIAEITDPERPVSMDQLLLEFSPEQEASQSGFPWGKALIGAMAIGGLVAVWHYTPLATVASPDRIIEWAEDFGSRPWTPFAVIAAYTPASFVMFPRPLITLAAVVAFGPWLGVGYASAGILLAAAANYLVGRRMQRATVRRIAGERLNRVSEVLRRRGLVAMTVVRLVPIAPFPVVGLVAGAIRVRFRDYLVGTLLGMLPGAVATTVFGDQLTEALHDPSRINYWLIAGVIAAFAAGIVAVRRWFRREFARNPPGSLAQPRAA
jgi:phosphatidylserine/phosphatidylglycerophosphate/cardiolipin synthase-like enzyme/uncharacterized membrane protein YdjX (TVP38/TMEM64 family)